MTSVDTNFDTTTGGRIQTVTNRLVRESRNFLSLTTGHGHGRIWPSTSRMRYVNGHDYANHYANLGDCA
jgi:hypothetical protein